MLGGHGPKNYRVLLDELLLEQAHVTQIFTESTDLVIEFTAGTPANTWGAWAEIEDDTPITPITFSSRIADDDAHLTALQVEDLDTDDKRYMIEIAHGDVDTKTVCCRHRFISGDTKKLAAINFSGVRAHKLSAGETMYYRMKCETAGATCEVSLRYHLHE